MIVVGFLGGSDGLASEIARRAAAAGGTGARVEMVGAAAPGPAGDARLIELAASGVGHATVLRTHAESLDSKDLELALQYLPDVRCVVLVRPPQRLLGTALAAVDWAGAALVVVGPLDADAVATLDAANAAANAASSAVSSAASSAASAAAPSSAAGPIVLDPPADSDPDGTFAGFAAALATRLDAGEPAETAFRATVAALAVDSV